MKLLIRVLSVVALFGVAHLAHADHRHTRVGVYFGVPGPWYYSPPPTYYYPPYYYEPRVVVVPPPQPTVYVERAPDPPPPVVAPAPAPAQPAPGFWYYCRPAKAYYPYVKDCPEAWQQVSPQPASTR